MLLFGLLALALNAVTPVTVKMSDTRTTLSRLSAPAGTVVFAVTNVGRKPHAFDVAGHETPSLLPGRSTTLKVTLNVPLGYAYSGSSRGVFHIVAPAGAPTATASTSSSPAPSTSTAPGACTTTSTVRLTMNDAPNNGGFTFSPLPIPCGTVTFLLSNVGQSPHGLQLVDPNGTTIVGGAPIGPNQSATVTVSIVSGEYQWRDSQTDDEFGAFYVR